MRICQRETKLGQSSAPRQAKPRLDSQRTSKPLALEDILMNCRNLLRGKMANADKRDLLLTLVFLRFLGDRYEQQRQRVERKAGTLFKDSGSIAENYAEYYCEDPDQYARAGVIYLPPGQRWSDLCDLPPDTQLPLTLDSVLTSLETQNPKLQGAFAPQIFHQSGVPPQTLVALLQELSKISQQRFEEKDLIGHVYEYFLVTFATQGSKEEGEFYTPPSVVGLIARLVAPTADGTIYDPCCGSGGMFVQSVKLIAAHGGRSDRSMVYGQEVQPETYRLAKMNLAARGIEYNLELASTFADDRFVGEQFDYIMANPPFNLSNWRGEQELLDDPRWQGYGVPPAANANYAWILHILSHLRPGRRIAGFLLSNGALDDPATRNIRQRLVENDKVEAIVVLPRNMFYTTDIGVTLWMLNEDKRSQHHPTRRAHSGEVLFVDLRAWPCQRSGKQSHFSDADIEQIGRIYDTWLSAQCPAPYSQAELYRSASAADIAAANYSLAPSRYIAFHDRDADRDLDALLRQQSAELRSLVSELHADASRLEEALDKLGL